jgi:hypothetical protein
LRVNPGDSELCVVTIRNRHAASRTFRLEPQGVRGSHSGAGVRFSEPQTEEARDTAGAWITPLVSTVTIPPRGVAEVPVRVTIPPDPPRGAAYATLDVVPAGRSAAGDTQVQIESRVAVPFLLDVSGKGRPKLSLHDPRAQSLRWGRDPWTFRAELDNDGSLHATTSGRVRIRSIFGNEVASLPVSDQPVLPGGRQPIIESWDDVPWFGLYRYDVRMSDANAPGHPVARASGWFIALPNWWILALAAALLCWQVAGMVLRRRRRQRAADADTHDEPEFDEEY